MQTYITRKNIKKEGIILRNLIQNVICFGKKYYIDDNKELVLKECTKHCNLFVRITADNKNNTIYISNSGLEVPLKFQGKKDKSIIINPMKCDCFVKLGSNKTIKKLAMNLEV
jgi:hypothetical protein